MLDYDVETTGLQWTHDELFLTQFLDESGTPELLRHPEDRAAIQQRLSDTDTVRAHNGKFDLHFTRAAGYTLPPESGWHDSMVVCHIVDERISAALQLRGNKLFGDEEAGAPLEKAVKDFLAKEKQERSKAAKENKTQLIKPNYSDVPREIMDPYAAHDVVLQRKLCDVLMPRIDANPEFKALYAMERECLGALFWMEDRGIPFDRERLIRLEASLLDQLEIAEARAIELSGFRNFNPRSFKQISEALDRLGADTRFMTRDSETKILVTDEMNLNACPHPLAEAVLAYRGVKGLFSTVHRILHGKPSDDKFPHPYLTSDDRVHPDFRQVGARTGRMSCANPNFQNIPRDDLRLRYCVRASPGKQLVSCDLDGIELRLLVAFAGEGALKEMVLHGGDPHQYTADMLGLTGRKRSTGVDESPRDQGKRVNYLKPYGGGTNALRKFLMLSQDRARECIRQYEAAYPEVKQLEDRIEIALEDRGYVKTPWGRRFRVQRNARQESYKFLARLIQGTAADLFKDSLVKVHKQGVPIIAVVHDEIIAEVDPSDAAEAAHIIEEAFTNHDIITGKIPLEASSDLVDCWADAKKPGYVPDHERS